jgi:Domain of unknown function (DUF5666)
MIQKTLVTVSLGGLLLMGAPGALLGYQLEATHAQFVQDSQDRETRTVSGKVTDIGDSGHSFTVETDDGGNKQTMKFVVDKDTEVHGHVKVGTLVAVDYQPTEDGELLCVRVTPENS